MHQLAKAHILLFGGKTKDEHARCCLGPTMVGQLKRHRGALFDTHPTSVLITRRATWPPEVQERQGKGWPQVLRMAYVCAQCNATHTHAPCTVSTVHRVHAHTLDKHATRTRSRSRTHIHAKIHTHTHIRTQTLTRAHTYTDTHLQSAGSHTYTDTHLQSAGSHTPPTLSQTFELIVFVCCVESTRGQSPKSSSISLTNSSAL
jgi:hypothetical protein